MDVLDFDGQPHCPNDNIVMRDVPGGWEYPHCGHLEMLPREAAERALPPNFEGPAFKGF